jgi:hypothetical protein
MVARGSNRIGYVRFHIFVLSNRIIPYTPDNSLPFVVLMVGILVIMDPDAAMPLWEGIIEG